MTDFVLTGLPRSGTTLVCHLLNKLPNVVALHEPIRGAHRKAMLANDPTAVISSFFIDERARILSTGFATSKSANGKVPTNPLSDIKIGERRQRVIDGDSIKVENVARDDFDLFIKQPSLFTGCLPILSKKMHCFATVRNPLSVILSWRASGMNVSRGRIPAAEDVDTELRASLDRETDVLERQLFLLDYFFGRFLLHLPDRVVRYEDVVESGGRALTIMTPKASELDEALSSRNALVTATDPDAAHIAQRVVGVERPCWAFYNREDVMKLVR